MTSYFSIGGAHVQFYLDDCIVSVYAHGTEVKNGDSAECDVKEVVDLRRLVLVSQLYLPSTDVKMFLLISSARKGLEGVPKKCTIRPKLSAVGLNFTMNMTWEGLIRLSLSRKRPKN